MTENLLTLLHVQSLFRRCDLIAAACAIDAWRAAMPDDHDALACLAHLLRLRGRHADAREALDRALDASPGAELPLVEMARLANATAGAPAALPWYNRAWQARPNAIDWLDEWFDVLLRCGHIGQASFVAARLCECAPDRADNWFKLGLAHQQQGAHAAAVEAYRRAMALDPLLPMLANNLAAAHVDLGGYDTARPMLENVISREPNHAFAWTNLANLHLKCRAPEASLIAAERACALAPDFSNALQARANALKELQCWNEARAVTEHAARGAPDRPGTAWSLAMMQLVHGDYHNGWINHEARWAGAPELRGRHHRIDRPQWQGQPLAGKTLFVWGEQGFGDALQFVRFVPMIAERVRREGGRLVYCCFADLLPLFSRSLAACADHIVPHDMRPLPPFDYHLPLCSLPLMLGITLETLPRRVPYLTADTERVAHWRERLSHTGTLKVGLVWTGNRTHQRNPLRSVSSVAYADAFAALPNIEFHNLQLDAHAEVMQAREAGLALVDHADALQTFDDTAALVCNLDLVITVCTSVAHLSGALGIPTWLLLDVNPHWVWMLERNDSPWYPTTRLYRQARYGEWRSVLDRLRADLTVLSKRGRALIDTHPSGHM
ncbi:tetratricopeptide repeat protein [Burkholderia pyrrocinia]|uniref:tetratricopeptide repeat protein n=1 Tax=Burkholderia pyrrocinia TaxID=60550 RepID=UPI0015772185|nr:tetratricopeptide repeat protein [Burkholderia pyrrocinia]NTX26681.1 tetratricopeptide repeat protein [Burkholderia pyrrocinia]